MANFVPRLNELSPTNMHLSPIYNQWNAYEQIGWGLPNCTAYAWGRFWEIYGPQNQNDNRPTLSMYDAYTWYGYTQDGYERGQVAKLGAVACWESTIGGLGHVAIVEQINSDGSYIISNSALNDFYFRIYTIQPDNYFSSEYQFQGFIYNPYVTPKRKFMLAINKRKFMKRRGFIWR